VYVLSAGGAGDLAGFTPQRVGEAITVASTTPADGAMNNTYGPHLTLFAPGAAIQGAGNASDSATFAGDGDSYAAPLVAGVSVLYLQQHPTATPGDVKQALLAAATRDALTGVGDSPNLLLHLIVP
jgi:subtilisin family serine protease